MKETLIVTCPFCTASKLVEYDEEMLNEYIHCECTICGAEVDMVVRKPPKDLEVSPE